MNESNLESGMVQKDDHLHTVKLDEVVSKRSENVDPSEVNVERNIGLEHIQSNNPNPNWEPIENVSSTKRRFYAGDILFAKLRPNLEKAAQPDFDGVCSTDIFTLTASEDVNSRYILYQLSTKSAFDWARRTAAGTRMPRTSWGFLKDFQFNIPPIQDQRRIATVLMTVDDLIENSELIAEKYEKIKREYIRKAISGGISTEQTTENRIGPKRVEIPQSWIIKQIGEFTDIKNGNRIVKGHEYADQETGYPFIRISDMKEGTVDTSELKYLKPETAEEMDRGIISSDDVYITVTGSVGEAGTIPEELDGARFTDNAAKLHNLKGVQKEYLKIYLRSKFGRDEVRRFTVGSTQPKLSMYRVKRMEVIIPPTDKQNEIIETVNSIDESSRLNKQYCQRLSRIKSGLMQDLLENNRHIPSEIDAISEVEQYG